MCCTVDSFPDDWLTRADHEEMMRTARRTELGKKCWTVCSKEKRGKEEKGKKKEEEKENIIIEKRVSMYTWSYWLDLSISAPVHPSNSWTLLLLLLSSLLSQSIHSSRIPPPPLPPCCHRRPLPPSSSLPRLYYIIHPPHFHSCSGRRTRCRTTSNDPSISLHSRRRSQWALVRLWHSPRPPIQLRSKQTTDDVR